MQNDTTFTYHKNVLWIPITVIITIWVVYWIEIYFGFNFNKFGIFPRDFKGLRGVFLSPFIHSDTSHLFNNSVPLFVLMVSLFYFTSEIILSICSIVAAD